MFWQKSLALVLDSTSKAWGVGWGACLALAGPFETLWLCLQLDQAPSHARHAPRSEGTSPWVQSWAQHLRKGKGNSCLGPPRSCPPRPSKRDSALASRVLGLAVQARVMAEAKGAQTAWGDWKERGWRQRKANSRKGEEKRGEAAQTGVEGIGGPGEFR